MGEKNKVKYIGARFTKKEKEEIEGIANLREITLSDFLRNAVFLYINHLKKRKILIIEEIKD